MTLRRDEDIATTKGGGAESSGDPAEGETASAEPRQDEKQERQSDNTRAGNDGQQAAAGQPSRSGSAMDTSGVEQCRQVEHKRDELADEREVKRRLTAKTTATRLFEKAENPESKKLKTDELVSMMGACMGAIASKDLESSGENIAMAKPVRTLGSIRKGRKVQIHRCTERGVDERWSRTEALKTGVPIFRSRRVGDPFKEKSRYIICEYATYKAPAAFAAT